MKFSLILEDENGDQIDMTTTANQYMTSEIDGLYPPAGTISTSTYASTDGSYLNNAFIEKRNLVISLYNIFRLVKDAYHPKISCIKIHQKGV